MVPIAPIGRDGSSPLHGLFDIRYRCDKLVTTQAVDAQFPKPQSCHAPCRPNTAFSCEAPFLPRFVCSHCSAAIRYLGRRVAQEILSARIGTAGEVLKSSEVYCAVPTRTLGRPSSVILTVPKEGPLATHAISM
jgi:hypothetical protein